MRTRAPMALKRGRMPINSVPQHATQLRRGHHFYSAQLRSDPFVAFPPGDPIPKSHWKPRIKDPRARTSPKAHAPRWGKRAPNIGGGRVSIFLQARGECAWARPHPLAFRIPTQRADSVPKLAPFCRFETSSAALGKHNRCLFPKAFEGDWAARIVPHHIHVPPFYAGARGRGARNRKGCRRKVSQNHGHTCAQNRRF